MQRALDFVAAMLLPLSQGSQYSVRPRCKAHQHHLAPAPGRNIIICQSCHENRRADERGFGTLMLSSCRCRASKVQCCLLSFARCIVGQRTQAEPEENEPHLFQIIEESVGRSAGGVLFCLAVLCFLRCVKVKIRLDDGSLLLGLEPLLLLGLQRNP